MNIDSTDYHDFVFRDGQLVGEFEQMYRNAKAIPWHQDETAFAWHTDLAITLLQSVAPFDEALEIGCGLGYFSKRIIPLCRSFTGVDVSETAVVHASKLNPHANFHVLDVTSGDLSDRLGTDFDLVIQKDLFWYVFPEMDSVCASVENVLKPGGYLLTYQSFPALDSSFVGKEVISSPDELVGRFDALEPIYTLILDRHQNVDDGPLLISVHRRN